MSLVMNDEQIANLIAAEEQRQRDGLELIPSENYVSRDVLTALGSVFTTRRAILRVRRGLLKTAVTGSGGGPGSAAEWEKLPGTPGDESGSNMTGDGQERMPAP